MSWPMKPVCWQIKPVCWRMKPVHWPMKSFRWRMKTVLTLSLRKVWGLTLSLRKVWDISLYSVHRVQCWKSVKVLQLMWGHLNLTLLSLLGQLFNFSIIFLPSSSVGLFGKKMISSSEFRLCLSEMRVKVGLQAYWSVIIYRHRSLKEINTNGPLIPKTLNPYSPGNKEFLLPRYQGSFLPLKDP